MYWHWYSIMPTSNHQILLSGVENSFLSLTVFVCLSVIHTISNSFVDCVYALRPAMASLNSHITRQPEGSCMATWSENAFSLNSNVMKGLISGFDSHPLEYWSLKAQNSSANFIRLMLTTTKSTINWWLAAMNCWLHHHLHYVPKLALKPSWNCASQGQAVYPFHSVPLQLHWYHVILLFQMPTAEWSQMQESSMQ